MDLLLHRILLKQNKNNQYHFANVKTIEDKKEMQEKLAAPAFPNPDVFNPRSLASTYNMASQLYSGLASPGLTSPAGFELSHQANDKIVIDD